MQRGLNLLIITAYYTAHCTLLSSWCCGRGNIYL